MNNSSDIIISHSVYGGGRLGESISSVGDINGDGYSDIVVGAASFGGSSNKLGRAFVYLGGSDEAIPVFNLSAQPTVECSSLTGITSTWKGRSSVAASTNNLVLQVYRFGSTNAWETIDLDSSLTANSYGSLAGNLSTSLDEYCDEGGTTYWRVYQESGRQTLETDVFTIELEGDVAQASKPQMSQMTRGGMWFKEGVKQPYSFIK